MNRTRLLGAFLLGSLLPTAALAATVASTSIPDGTYTVTVLRVLDAKHVDIKMDNGQESTLAAGRPSVDFSKIRSNDQIKLSLINGNVMVYLDLTNH